MLCLSVVLMVVVFPQDGADRPLIGRWAQFLAGRSSDDLCASPELKGLLRGGVPREYRQQVWTWLVRARTRSARERHPQRYQQVHRKYTGSTPDTPGLYSS